MVNHVILFIIVILPITKSSAISFPRIGSIMGQTISTTQFFLYGKRHFTQTGYHRHLKKYTEPVQTNAAIGIGKEGADGTDLSGKVVVVTGANSGIGKEVATYCAAKGAKLYMICRNKERAEAARDEIAKLTGSDTLDVVLADVSELDDVRKAAATLQGKEKEIYALVCNAGLIAKERKDTKDGIESSFSANFLGGTYLLSKLLMPQIKAAKDSRVVFVSSGGMYNYKLPSWDVLVGTSKTDKFDGVSAYAYAKRGQILLAERWTQEHPDVKFVTVHPGWTDTPGVNDALSDQKPYLQPLRSLWEGSEGICWLIGTNRDNLRSGEFYLDREPQQKHLAGPFFSEGSYTKNKKEEVDSFLEKLKETTGV